MDAQRKTQLIRQRAVAKAALTRMQTFIETGDRKINDIQVRFEELPNIYNKFELAQSELELFDEVDHSTDRQQFENEYFDVKARFNELLHPVVEPPVSRSSSPRSSVSQHSNISPRSRHRSTHIKLPTITLPTFDGDTGSWLHFRDTFEAMIVNNRTLSNVQKFHYLIASLKNEAKALMSNLQITNENFTVAWRLVTQRYNNKRLIAMTHTNHLCQMPQVRQADVTSLRQLINHVTSHMNALEALTLNVSFQDLMLNHMMLATLYAETHREWEVLIAAREDMPTTLELITFLETRCRALELLHNTQPTRASAAPARTSQPSPSKVKVVRSTLMWLHKFIAPCAMTLIGFSDVRNFLNSNQGNALRLSNN
jgi:hypothetical protein